MVDNSLLEDFIMETQEHLEEMESAMLRLEETPGDKNTINTIFRQIHTIKGSSEYLGMQRIGELAHRLEALLETVRKGKISIHRKLIDLLLASKDRISQIIRELADGGSEESPIEDLLAGVEKISDPKSEIESRESKDTGKEMIQTEEETDPELYDIFIGQLNSGFNQVKQLAVQLAGTGSPTNILGRLTAEVKGLRSSANYMGYDALTQVYDQLLQRIGETDLRILEERFDKKEFIETQIAPALETVSRLIPGARLDPVLEWSAMDSVLDSEISISADTKQEEPLLFEDLTDSLLIEEDFSEEKDSPLKWNPRKNSSAPAENTLTVEFIEEASDHLAEMEDGLLLIQDAEKGKEAINTVFRAVHTIKGSAEYIGLTQIAELCHALEDLLELLRQGKRNVNSRMTDLLLEAKDLLNNQVASLIHGGSPTVIPGDLISRIRSDAKGLPLEREENSTGNPLPSSTDVMGKHQFIFGETYDAELFGIFMVHLEEQLHEMKRWPDSVTDNGDLVAVMDKCREILLRMRFSANYMGYESLCGFYDEWLKDLSDLASIVQSSENQGALKSIHAAMNPRFQELDQIVLRYHVTPNKIDDIAEFDQTSVQKAETLGEAPSAAKALSPISEDPDEIDVLEQFAAHDEMNAPFNPGIFGETDRGIGKATYGSDAIPIKDPEEISSSLYHRLQNAFELHSSRMDSDDEFMEKTPADSHIPLSTDAVAAVVDSGNPEVVEPLVEKIAQPVKEGPAKTPVPMDEMEPQTLPSQQPEIGHQDRLLKHTIRVDATKVDTLMNQVGELVVTRSLFSQLNMRMHAFQLTLKHIEGLGKQDLKKIRDLGFQFAEATVALGRVANDLQEGIMKVRMLPVSQLFNRYPRLVHDLTRNSDKKVRLVIDGGETELDKMVIEEIADPLVHILRNAVDHGIETATDRGRAGKPETGTIRLNAFHESNHVVIEISDDGRGIDEEKVKQKALETGLLKPDRAGSITRKEVLDFIHSPGFSTADHVTHTSGRGVGMDVVKRNIEQINGTLETDSTPGHGTRFRIKIPLTLAIFSALLVKVEDAIYTIPLSSVEETLRVFSHELTMIEGVEVLQLRKTPLPLIRVAEVLNIRTDRTEREKLFVVVVSYGEQRLGLVVDELIGQEEVVIKPLEDYLQENSGFSGATILGDGQISLILDISGLIKLSMDKQIRMKVESEVA
jgi:two-component system, chemotaxis family, sensor kinase CheA